MDEELNGSPTKAMSRYRKKIILTSAIAAIIVIGLGVYYVVSDLEANNTQSTVTFNVSTSVWYAGSWNGTYSYGQSSSEKVVLWSGFGPKTENVTFQGSLYSALCYWVHIQKDDNSSTVLTLTERSIYAGGPTMVDSNSTSSPFGVVGLGYCVIS